jgi:hypothetical protein
MTMGMSIEPGLLAPQLNISSRISDVEFNLCAKSCARAILLRQAQISMSSYRFVRSLFTLSPYNHCACGDGDYYSARSLEPIAQIRDAQVSFKAVAERQGL